MALMRLINQVKQQQLQLRQLNSLFLKTYKTSESTGGSLVCWFGNSQGRFRSSYVGRFSRRGRETDEFSDAGYLKEMNLRYDPKAVIRLFESQPSLHSNSTAIAEYFKALDKIDRLDGSELLKRGNSPLEEQRVGALSAFRNVKYRKDGGLSTASRNVKYRKDGGLIHVVATEGSNFITQLCRAVSVVCLTFVLISKSNYGGNANFPELLDKAMIFTLLFQILTLSRHRVVVAVLLFQIVTSIYGGRGVV